MSEQNTTETSAKVTRSVSLDADVDVALQEAASHDDRPVSVYLNRLLRSTLHVTD